MKYLSLFIFTCTLLSGCTRENNLSCNIKAVDSFDLADHGLISSNFNIFAESDSVLTIQNIPNQLYRVDLKKKKIINVLDSLSFNIDSLINITFQKKNIKGIVYSKHTPEELQNYDKSLFQVYSVAGEGDKLYIPIAITAEAGYLTAEQVKNAFGKESDNLLSSYGTANIKSTDYLNFLLITDRRFKVIDIKPLYPLDKKENNYLMPLKGCFVLNDVFYCPIVSHNVNGVVYDSVSIENNEPSFFLNTFPLNDPTKIKNIIPKNLVNSKNISIQSHLLDEMKYTVYKGALISILGNELIDITNNRLFEFQPVLASNENIEDLNFIDNCVCLIISKKVKTPASEQVDRHFGTTMQIAEKRIKIYDIDNGNELISKIINKDYVNRFYNNLLFSMSSGEKKTPVIYTYKININK